MIYLDNNATTPIAPEVLDAMMPFLRGSFGNASSGHSFGRESKRAIQKARESVAELLGAAAPEEIIFTSGGTESDNWAILAALESTGSKRQIVTSRVEHEAVRKLCEALERRGVPVAWIEVDSDGTLDLDQLCSNLSAETALVSIMLANNETGVIFPVEEIARRVKERSSALVHVDGVNACGKISIDLKNTEIDLFSISGHKFHAPKGIGALYVKNETAVPPMLIGGGQEFGKRSGTEAVHQIAGLGAAADLVKDMSPMERVARLRTLLESEILDKIPNSRLNGTSDPLKRLPNTANISFEGVNGERIMAELDDMGICVSTGSACHSPGHVPSAVLAAMNIPYSYAMGSIRFSLCRYSTGADVKAVAEALPSIVNKLRAAAGI